MKKIKEFIRSHKVMQKLWAVGRQLFMLGISYVVLYPLLYMVSNAFKPVEQYYDPSVVWIPKSLTMENFKIVALVMDIGNVMKNTVIIELLPAIISAMVCMMIGYGLARFNFRGKRFAGGLRDPDHHRASADHRQLPVFQLPLFRFSGNSEIPAPVHPGSGYHQSDRNALGDHPALTAGCGPEKRHLYLHLYAVLYGLPKELQEAASHDGCGEFRTFLKIIVPTAKNINIAVLLLAVVWNWNDYYTPSMFIRTKDTIATAMASFQANLENLHNMGIGVANIQTAQTQIQAACLITILPLVVLYIFLQKRFSEGIENSGLTGI